MTVKLTVSLTDEVAAYAKANAPGGNTSAYIDRAVRRLMLADALQQRAAAGLLGSGGAPTDTDEETVARWAREQDR
jgi:hypothetical protein